MLISKKLENKEKKMEFYQTRLGQKFYEKDLPSLIKELGELKQEIAELNKPKESMVVKLEREDKLGETIKKYVDEGWFLKHYLPQHHPVSTILVFEK